MVAETERADRARLRRERAALARARREIERQRAQAQARQELLGIVTHELKTPVAVLKAYTELLLGRAESSGRTEEVEILRRMEDQAERLLAMVEQVLDLQRLDAGLFPLEIGRVELGALVQRVLEGLQLTARDVQLRVEAPYEVWVRADRRRIEQVLINLVQNAIRFSPHGGEVRVGVGTRDAPPDAAVKADAATTAVPDGRGAERGPDGDPPATPATVRANRSPDTWAVVSVADRGPGVADADRKRIFGRFYQGRGGATLHRGHGGLGVGLYIAREVVARHGGELWLEEAAGEAGEAGEAGAGGKRNGRGDGGATFTFVLPASGPDEEE